MTLEILQIVTVLLVAVAMIPAVAHALELPGKMRLGKDNYFAVQRIYYPGFTFAGIAEPVSFLSTIALLFFTPRETLAFWLTVLVGLCLLFMQAVYWIFVHPVNTVWVEGESMGALGSGFFGFGRPAVQSGTHAPDWTDFRRRWEYAHLVRASLVAIGFLALIVAIS